MKFKNRYIAYLLCFITVSSCLHKTECDETVNSSAKLGFYGIVNKKAVSMTYDNVTVYGLSSDSLIYNDVDSVRSVTLPMNHSADSCIFVMRVESVTDTLMFRYTRKLEFISENCGFSTEFRLTELETTNHNIDSVKIENPEINSSKSENIQIYY